MKFKINLPIIKKIKEYIDSKQSIDMGLPYNYAEELKKKQENVNQQTTQEVDTHTETITGRMNPRYIHDLHDEIYYHLDPKYYVERVGGVGGGGQGQIAVNRYTGHSAILCGEHEDAKKIEQKPDAITMNMNLAAMLTENKIL